MTGLAKQSDPSFVASQQVAQGAYFNSEGHGRNGYGGAAYRLAPQDLQLNLAPAIRDAAPVYFDERLSTHWQPGHDAEPRRITWHRHASHGLSSQACCLNFLMPLARRDDVLSKLVGVALGITPPRMLEVEAGPDGEPWFVGFEWLGEGNPLGEWPPKGRPTRGANATSADAVVKFHHLGHDETLLIEWKYTERYRGRIPEKRTKDGLSGGDLTRIKRYANKAFDPDGPIRGDIGLTLEDFFFEPFYQLLRQQMLAWRLERLSGERVRVLHISPRANTDLHAVTSRAFQDACHTDAFDAFKSALVRPRDGVDRFVNRHTEDVFGLLLSQMPDDPWAAYLLGRYTFLTAENA